MGRGWNECGARVGSCAGVWWCIWLCVCVCVCGVVEASLSVVTVVVGACDVCDVCVCAACGACCIWCAQLQEAPHLVERRHMAQLLRSRHLALSSEANGKTECPFGEEEKDTREQHSVQRSLQHHRRDHTPSTHTHRPPRAAADETTDGELFVFRRLRGGFLFLYIGTLGM